MTVLPGPEPSAQILARLAALTPDQVEDLMCRANVGVWAERKRGFSNAPFHWEWYEWAAKSNRLCLVAPREHAKTEVITVNRTAHQSIYTPGLWTYIFSQTKEQAEIMLERIDSAVEEADPSMTVKMKVNTATRSTYSNGSRITVAGAGKAVRSAHPDVIICDDVLSEETARSQLQRDRVSTWFFGTVSNMAHPGTTRKLGRGKDAKLVTMPPTRIILVGTPFHRQDLLMQMKDNPLYVFRRYSAEFHPAELVDGWAIEIG